MGLMDKVKAQAAMAAQKTQEAAREGKARIDQAQANKHADGLLRNLGALVYAERTGRAAPDTQDQMTKVIAEISAHEAENGINLSNQPTSWTAVAQGQGAPPQGQYGQPAQGQQGQGQGGAPFSDPGSSSFPQASTSFPQSDGPTSFPDSGSTGTSAFPPDSGTTQV